MPRATQRVFVNPGSGPDDSLDALTEVFGPAAVVEIDPKELSSALNKEVAAGVPTVAVAGGDGTLRTAAAALAGATTSLLVVPWGTRNHFAKDLGLPTLDEVAEAIDRGGHRRIDLGSVNGHRFVNNAVIGFYPEMVQQREEIEGRTGKALASIRAAWTQLRTSHRLRLRLDGRPRTVWAVFIGNNCYGVTARTLAQREHLDEGVLDVRVLMAKGRLSRVRIAGAVLFGRLDQSPLVERHMARSFLVSTGSTAELAVALDGEVRELEAPLRFVSEPAVLTVLVPPR